MHSIKQTGTGLVVIESTPLAMRSAVLEDGKLCELIIDKVSNRSLVGNIYLARVQNILPAQFAFMDIGEEKAAFLFLDDRKENGVRRALKRDKELLVQVTKDPTGDKGAYVTASLSLSGRYCVLMPDGGTFSAVSKKIEDKSRRGVLTEIANGANKRGFGIIMRTNCEEAGDGEILDEIDSLVSEFERLKAESAYLKAPSIVRREAEPVSRLLKEIGISGDCPVIANDASVIEEINRYSRSYNLNLRAEPYSGERPIFERFGISQQIERLFFRKIWLKSGAFIIIESTEALHVIDVNSGKFAGSGGYGKTVLKVNMEAAEEAARQIRLRNLSGIILIDFIDMKDPADKAALEEALRSFCRKDRIAVNVVGMTPLGLMEITRKKGREPLNRIMLSECRECGGYGSVRNAFSIAVDAYNELTAKAAATGAKSVRLQADADVLDELRTAGLPEGLNVVMSAGRPKHGEYKITC